MRMNQRLESGVFDPARLTHLVAPEVQIPVREYSGELVDETSDNGQQLRMRRIEGNAPMLELGDVRRA